MTDLLFHRYLADFQKDRPEAVIDNILLRLKQLVNGELYLEKYAKQLEVLSKLRNLQPITVQKIAIMPIVYDLKTDIRFLQGKEIGEELGKEIGKERGKIEERKNSQMRFCIKLLKAKIFPVTTIAEMVEQTTNYVLEVQTYLQQEELVRKALKNGMEAAKIAKKAKVSVVFVWAIEHFIEQEKQK